MNPFLNFSKEILPTHSIYLAQNQFHPFPEKDISCLDFSSIFPKFFSNILNIIYTYLHRSKFRSSAITPTPHHLLHQPASSKYLHDRNYFQGTYLSRIQKKEANKSYCRPKIQKLIVRKLRERKTFRKKDPSRHNRVETLNKKRTWQINYYKSYLPEKVMEGSLSDF